MRHKPHETATPEGVFFWTVWSGAVAVTFGARPGILFNTMARRPASLTANDDDDDFYCGSNGAAEQQRLLVREQDDTIGALGKTVERVHGMATMVNEELASQNRLISEIDEDVEKTDSRLRMMHSKLRNLANDSDRGKYCLIVVLLIVLAILTMAVLS